MANHHNTIDWEVLLDRIKRSKCTPFLGAGFCSNIIPDGRSIALKLAKLYNYPLEDNYDLARVTQFIVTTKDDAAFMKQKVLDLFFEDINSPNFKDQHNPYSILSKLPIPIFLTTNYDNFLIEALSQNDFPRKNPRREICIWHKNLKEIPSVWSKKKKSNVFEPTEIDPIVFHLHGHIDEPSSMVISEDDYLDFMINLSRDPDVMPKRIRRAFASTSLLFLGYSLSDWNFRIIFRNLVIYIERCMKTAHVSVQLSPIKDGATPEQKLAAQEYLNKYFGNLNIQIYWGTCQEFMLELKNHWEKFNHEQ